MKGYNLYEVFINIKKDIDNTLSTFNRVINLKSDKLLFKELAFCLLTPQSKAEICWLAIENLYQDGVLFKGSNEEILPYLKGVRFKNNKSKYIALARDNFFSNKGSSLYDIIVNAKDVFKLREWLVKNIKGLGFKEASHFLRNIGFYRDIAILDRHILRFLNKEGIIDSIPTSLTKKKYLDIEKKMHLYSLKVNIPLQYLDFVIWYIQTGRIFK